MIQHASKQGRWHRRLRTVILAFVGLGIAFLLGMRSGYLGLPVAVFPFILLLVAAPTLFWWSWIDERIAAVTAGRRGEHTRIEKRDHQTEAAETRTPGRGDRGTRREEWRFGVSQDSTLATLLRLFVAGYAAAMLLPLLMLLIGRRSYDALPVPLLMWLMIWHFSMVVAGLVGLLTWGSWIVVQRLRSLSLAFAGDERGAEPDPSQASAIQMSRRAVLTGALSCAPMILSGSALTSGLRQEGRFTIRRIELRVPRLPERLRGLTLTHLSDFHLGRLFRPEHLDRVVEATNRLDSDIIAITGDIVDHSADFLPVACEAFSGMQSRYGRFVVAGNHDLIDSPRQAVEYLSRYEPNFLADRCITLNIGGEQLRMAGLFWSRHDRARFGSPGHYERVAHTLPAADPSPFTIALAHHPHAFDALADAGVDLTLAGHTHGGQLMATPPGFASPVGAGNLLFRYIWGEYRRGDSAMYVSSGVGNWFPVRINAAAEIVQIRLV